MKRLINVRPALFCALALAGGILCGFALVTKTYYLFAVAFSAAFTLVVFLLFFAKKYQKLLFVCLSFFVFGIGSVSLCANANEKRLSNFCKTVLNGYVSADSVKYDDYWLIKLSGARDENGRSLGGKVSFFLSDAKIKLLFDEQIEYGAKMEIECTLTPTNVFCDGINAFAYKNKEYYWAENVEIVDFHLEKLPFDETLRLYILNTFKANMSEENSAVATALVIGDKSGMAADDREAFRKSGVAHIFAVSGLHIGFVAALFSAIVYRAKIRRIFAFVLVAAPVLFYGYIVGFSPSATRAVIMTLCALIVRALGYRADVLSSGSLAAIIILVFRPLYVFDAGFLMSFGAVFGISTLGVLLIELLNKRKISPFAKKIFDGVCVTLGASAGVLPIVAAVYGEAFLLGVLSNAIIIPIVSVLFILLLIGLVPLGIGYITLFIPEKIIAFLRIFTDFLSKIPFTTVLLVGFGAGALFYYIGLFAVSGYVNLNKTKKFIVVSVCAALTVIFTCFAAIPSCGKAKIKFIDSYSGITIIANDADANVLIFSTFEEGSQADVILEYLAHNRHKNVYVFVNDMHSFSPEAVVDVCRALKINRVYSMKNSPLYAARKALEDGGVTAEYIFEEIGFGVSIRQEKGLGFDGFTIILNDKSFLVVQNVYPYFYGDEQYDFDVVYSAKLCDKTRAVFPKSKIITADFDKSDDIFSTALNGDFTFFVINGTIVTVD